MDPQITGAGRKRGKTLDEIKRMTGNKKEYNPWNKPKFDALKGKWKERNK